MTKVYVVRGRHGTKHKYHHDKECRYLGDNQLRSLTVDEAEAWEKEPCKVCSPEHDVDTSHANNPTSSPKQVLRDAGFDVE